MTFYFFSIEKKYRLYCSGLSRKRRITTEFRLTVNVRGRMEDEWKRVNSIMNRKRMPRFTWLYAHNSYQPRALCGWVGIERRLRVRTKSVRIYVLRGTGTKRAGWRAVWQSNFPLWYLIRGGRPNSLCQQFRFSVDLLGNNIVVDIIEKTIVRTANLLVLREKNVKTEHCRRMRSRHAYTVDSR